MTRWSLRQTGQEHVLDSIWSESCIATRTRSRIGVEGTYIAHRATPARFSWFVQVGLQAGLASLGQAEVTRTASTGYASLRALFGVDLRLGKQSPFWSALHLLHETRPGHMMVSLPSMQLSASGAWQALFGVRFDLR